MSKSVLWLPQQAHGLLKEWMKCRQRPTLLVTRSLRLGLGLSDYHSNLDSNSGPCSYSFFQRHRQSTPALRVPVGPHPATPGPHNGNSVVPSRVPTRQAALKALGAYDERAAPCSMSLLQASTEILPPASPLVCQRRRLKGELSIFTKGENPVGHPASLPFMTRTLNLWEQMDQPPTPTPTRNWKNWKKIAGKNQQPIQLILAFQLSTRHMGMITLYQLYTNRRLIFVSFTHPYQAHTNKR